MRRIATLAALAWLLAAPANAAAEPPRGAQQVAVIAGGESVVLHADAVQLLDAQGRLRDQLAVRGEALDTRPLQAAGADSLVVLLDANRSTPLILATHDGKLQRWPDLPAAGDQALAVQTLCLQRDEQGLQHLFVIAADGRAQEWLLSAAGQRLLRPLALPLDAAACRVDDRLGMLYVSEPAVGVWAYDVSREGAQQRQLIAPRQHHRQRHGQSEEALRHAPGMLAVAADGSVLVAAGAAIKRLHQDARRDWQLQPLGASPAQAEREIAALFIDAGPTATLVWSRYEDDDHWRQHALGRITPAAALPVLPIVVATAQTDTVARLGDAADDPAIWVHPTIATHSRILATNKKQGLLVYALDGRQLQLLEVGRVNNVDLRQQLLIDGQRLDVAVATQRDTNSLAVFSIDADGVVSDAGRIATGLREIYGICVGRNPAQGLDVFVNDKNGLFLQLRVSRQSGVWSAQELRRFSVAGQPEGCVVDERNARVFIGEERSAVWVLSADATQAATLQRVISAGDVVQADIEGLALYQGATQSYLLVSSQGNDSYVVLEANPPYRVRGAFRIGINLELGIDGSSETDGLEVSSQAFGAAYPQGLLVVQDGHKRLPIGAQNFKYISWAAVARALHLPLDVPHVNSQ